MQEKAWLKSALRGIEIVAPHTENLYWELLKSALRGIEIAISSSCARNCFPSRLKSALRGIEMLVQRGEDTSKHSLKSALRGIEMTLCSVNPFGFAAC